MTLMCNVHARSGEPALLNRCSRFVHANSTRKNREPIQKFGIALIKSVCAQEKPVGCEFVDPSLSLGEIQMAIWSYACRSCDGKDRTWHVSADRVADMPHGTRLVRVKAEDEWRCAVLISDAPVEIDAQLLRDVIPSTPEDCPECSGAILAETESVAAKDKQDVGLRPSARASAPGASLAAGGRPVQAAAISLLGVRFVVVLVPLELVRSPGEADMAVETLSPSFGGVPVVLMGQDENGSPQYHGATRLIEMLADVPIENMPWKDYPLR